MRFGSSDAFRATGDNDCSYPSASARETVERAAIIAAVTSVKLAPSERFPRAHHVPIRHRSHSRRAPKHDAPVRPRAVDEIGE